MRLDQARRRMIGVAAFDPSAYEELRDDPAATLYAVAVVVGATLIAAIGGLLWALVAAAPPEIYEVDIRRFILRSVLLGSVFQIGLWFVWVGMTWFYLRSIFLLPDVDLSRLLRTMGFAFAPMALQLLLIIPVLEFPVGMIAVGTTVGCSVLAVRAATGATPGQALVATVMGFAIFALGLGMLGTSDSDLAPGIFALDPNAISVYLRLSR
jgi:hypothetical protein